MTTFTPEHQARIDQFNALVRFASQQTGVVQIAETRSQDIRLPNGSTRTEVTAVILPAIRTDWQPPLTVESDNAPTIDSSDTNGDTGNESV